MRVALLSATAQVGDAIGNQLAEKVAFFLDRGADVRVFLESDRRLHPELRPHAEVPRRPAEVCRFLESADLVLAEYSQHCALFDLLPTLAGGRPRIIFDYHGVTPEQFADAGHREVLREGARNRGLVWSADAAVVHSRFASRELLGPTRFPKDRVTTLGYPVDTEWFCPGRPSRSLRVELGLEQALILLFVGRLAPNKRVPALVEALARLRSHPVPVHAVVIGDGTDIYQSERQRCEERASQLGIADRLHFLGHVDSSRLRDAYRSADLFVMPSRHEGFCIPVVEAMACGLPVIAAGEGALPETVGDAGLIFRPDDADDLVRRVLRISRQGDKETRRQGDKETISDSKSGARVAVIACRYGPDIVGGAEKSLRTIAETLHQAGNQVEVLTTTLRGEHPGNGQSAEGTEIIGGVRVRRFPLDPVDEDRHLAARQEIELTGGAVADAVEQEYLSHSARSSRLLAALDEEYQQFDALIVGPYLTGLTFDVARQFPEKTLLLPCFHGEPFARLQSLGNAYRQVGGILFHSPEEKELAEIELAVNHLNSVVCGTHIELHEHGNGRRGKDLLGNRRYVLYCGRYSPHKNLPTWLEWAERYTTERSGRFQFAFCGQGELALPRAEWLRDLGFVDRATQLDLLAGSDVLMQPSGLESLSLVALEAWNQGVPVLANADCAVLAGHIERGNGGRTVADYPQFAAALDELWEHPERWQSMGRQGWDYVAAHYGSSERFVRSLLEAIHNLSRPLAEQMRERGVRRAQRHSRAVWREQFANRVEDWLDAPPRAVREQVDVEPRIPSLNVAEATKNALISVRVHNRGSHAVVPGGPARAVLRAETVDGGDGPILETPLTAILIPGRTQTVAAIVKVSEKPGSYAVRLRVERAEGNTVLGAEAEVHLVVGLGRAGGVSSRSEQAATTRFNQGTDALPAILASAAVLQRLPDDYFDVTEGWLAGWKRWVKRKLLHNFRRAYVDVLSRQQSAFNHRAVTALQELAETNESLAALVQSIAKQLAESQQRCLALETRIARLEAQRVVAEEIET